MPRATRGPATHRRRKKILKAAKGYVGGRRKFYKTAKETVMRARNYAYRDRRVASACSATFGSPASTPPCA